MAEELEIVLVDQSYILLDHLPGIEWRYLSMRVEHVIVQESLGK